jgi:very-short-patch-repair endonuclease
MDVTWLLGLAEVQHGFVRREDARVGGLSRKAERGLVGRGEWEPAGPRLLRRTGAPMTAAAGLMRAVLDAGPGAVVSHRTAAAWWGLPGFDLLRPHVTRPRGITSAPPTFGQVLHEVSALSSTQVTVLDGIPIVRPERMAFDLFATEHPLRATRATETAWAKGLLSGPSLAAVLDELAERGRTGTVATRAFLESHDDLWVPPATNLESRFAAIMREVLLGPFRRQIDLGDDRWVGRVDFVHERFPLVVEVQSDRYHRALLDRAHDAARRGRLEDAGFVVVEVWDHEVWHDKDAVVARVRAAEWPLRGWTPPTSPELAADPVPNGTVLGASSGVGVGVRG